MNKIAIVGAVSVGAIIVLAASVWEFVGLTFSQEQLDACAAEAELIETIKYENGNVQEAKNAMSVDGDYRVIFDLSASYYRSLGLRTAYTGYAEKAPSICRSHWILGEKIAMPDISIQSGYHITRDGNGSAAVVKDGEQEPKFGCADGYHSSGRPYSVNDPSSGCQP